MIRPLVPQNYSSILVPGYKGTISTLKYKMVFVYRKATRHDLNNASPFKIPLDDLGAHVWSNLFLKKTLNVSNINHTWNCATPGDKYKNKIKRRNLLTPINLSFLNPVL